MAGVPGFEPGQNEPESFVLPLHYTPFACLKIAICADNEPLGLLFGLK